MISKVIYDADIDNLCFYSETKKNLFRDEARDEMKGARPTVYVAREIASSDCVRSRRGKGLR